MDKMEQVKVFLRTINDLIQSALSKAKFNTKKKATVQSLNEDGTANIIVSGITYNNVKIRAGLAPEINEVVWVEIPNGVFQDAFIDTSRQVIGGSSGGGGEESSEVYWSNIINKPSSSTANIDDAVSKRHEHDNKTVLDNITQIKVEAWDNKVDKVEGKELSTNDFNNTYKSKLEGIEPNANNYSHPPTHSPSIITQDSNNRFVTDAEKSVWNAKQNALGYTPENVSNKGVANGYAELDSSGKVPSSQLPSFVDDVLEYANISSFPTTGESGKIYITVDTNKTYRWSGSSYVEISASLALGETSSTAYRGDRGKTAYDHSQSTHAPSNAQKNSDITKAEIEAKLTGVISTHSHTNDHSHSNKNALDNVSGVNTGDETITSIGGLINGASAKTTPVDADMVGLMDSGASNVLKKLSWSNIKVTLKTYFDSLYSAISHTHSKLQITDFPTIPTDTSHLTKSDVYNKTEVDNKIASAGGGDMLKIQYDVNDDGIVDRAETADKLTTVRKINGVNFDGSADITITANPNSHTHTAGDLPNASTSVIGVVQLSDSTSSTSTTLAATANAVKKAYDIGNHSHPYASTSHTHDRINGIKITVGATAHSSPTTGDIWIDTN